MSYTTKIKEEISQIKNTKSESIAELSGFLRNNATYSNGILNLKQQLVVLKVSLKTYIN